MKTLLTILLTSITLSALSQKYDGYVMREGQLCCTQQIDQGVEIDMTRGYLTVEFGKDSVWTERVVEINEDKEAMYIVTENISYIFYQSSLISKLVFEGRDEIFTTTLYLVHKGWYDENTGLKEAWTASNYDSKMIEGL
jgi:hypothetical protein